MEFIISIIAFVLFVMVAAISSAIQDVNKNHWHQSIFNQPKNTKKIFGWVWNRWFEPESWLNKYKFRMPTQGKIKFKILFFRIHIVQLTNGWHFFKMIKIGAWLIAAFWFGMIAWFYNQFNPDLTGWITTGSGIVAGGALVWNLIFNLFLDKIFRKKNAA